MNCKQLDSTVVVPVKGTAGAEQATSNLNRDIGQTPALATTPRRDVTPIRNRIKEVRWIPAGDLLSNPKNWRRHPKAQADALRGVLREIGYADALLVRELPDGRLMLIDGQLRAKLEPDLMVLVLVLDVTEEEADKLLLTLDPLAAMAQADADRISQLLQTVQTEDQAVVDLLRRTAGEELWGKLHPDEIHEAEIPTERSEELREKWGVKVGQHWQIEQNRITCGDSCDSHNS